MSGNYTKTILVILLITILMIPFGGWPATAETEPKASVPNDAVEFSGHYYKVYEKAYTWTEAKAYCKSLGGHLMTITSPEEQDFTRYLPLKGGTNYWLGGTDEKEEGVWRWITGENWSYTAWSSGQPDNYQQISGVEEDYLQLYVDWDYGWNDSANVQDSSKEIGFICEWENLSVSAPTNVKASQPENNQVKLTWNAGINAKSYVIYRAAGSGGSFSKIGTTKKLNYTDKKVKNGKIYKYKIKALNGNSSATSSVVYAYPMAKPKSVRAKYDGKEKVTVTWKKVTGANRYFVYQKAPKDSGFKKVKTVHTTKAVISVSGGGIYKYYVVPVHDDFQGLKSATVSVKIAGKTVYRALMIGETYPGSEASLPACRNDAYGVKHMLDYLTGVDYAYTKVVLDATKSEFFSAISNVFGKADDDDVTLLYFAGHGLQIVDDYGNVVYDSPDLGALAAADACISARELRAELDQYKGKKLVLLDSCHSGNIIGKAADSVVTDKTLKAFNSAFIRAFSSSSARTDDNLAAKGYYVITACSKYQVSTDDGICGAFTSSLLYGLGWDEYNNSRLSELYADSDGNLKITWSEAYKWARTTVHTLNSEMDVQVWPVNCAEVFFAR